MKKPCASARIIVGFSVRKIAKSKWQILENGKPRLMVPTKTRAMKWMERRSDTTTTN